MKNFIYFYAIATLMLLLSCAGLKVERTVQDDNIFYSSNPKLKIKINPDFKHSGDYKRLESNPASNEATVMLDCDRDFYLFQNIIDGKFILIKFDSLRQPNSYFNPISFDQKKYLYDSGTLKLNGKKYKYGIFPEVKSYNKCNFLKVIATLTGGQNMTTIIYGEDISYDNSGTPWCNRVHPPLTIHQGSL